MSLDAEWAIQWVRRSAVVVQEHRDALTALDTAIGDGDHGANLERGYNAAVARLDEVTAAGQAPTTAGEVLQLVATSLITTVGGAAGPLLGTAMLRASHTVDGAQVDGAQVAQMLQAAADAVRLRGRAEAGDKTMLDAWQPAAAAARQAADRGEDPVEVLQAAATAAHEGAQETLPLKARKGRASFLGERSRGHLDPGACSTALLIQAAADTALAAVDQES
ncbi:dihydroxyacetone kinase subunit DhaL [Actinomyces urogenitalis]|uniref:dihydroxyacetone kinase subunit DhaL n=1 Tax=Actinomyces urogenitalis TaxID=103621 RepID=UPI002431BA6C|nr:dihydroxyacetone kinase subunit DhaL [Actinomyces urogenitalis]MCI7457899.1 dihydroxyacetone kinase subunit L [Actinomyces urogenitalis]